MFEYFNNEITQPRTMTCFCSAQHPKANFPSQLTNEHPSHCIIFFFFKYTSKLTWPTVLDFHPSNKGGILFWAWTYRSLATTVSQLKICDFSGEHFKDFEVLYISVNATTTQLLSSGEFWKLRYDTIPVKSTAVNFFFTPIIQKCQILSCNTLVANERYVLCFICFV